MAEKGVAKVIRNHAVAEDNRELMFPRSSRTYGKMLREDAKVRSVYRAVTLPIRRANWQLERNGADEQIVAHVAQDLRLQVRGEAPDQPVAPQSGRVSWEKHIEHALYALAYGHMFFEQVYAEGSDGREHLVKLAPRWPGTITRINVAEDGGLESIEQATHASSLLGSFSGAKIPVNQLVAYVFDDVGSQWLGTSIFRPAYKHWKLKDELLRKELQTIDRNGMGVPKATAAEYAEPGEQARQVELGQELAEAFRGGEAAGLSLPAGMKFELMGVSGQLVNPREAITYHDNQIAIAVLANFLNLEGKGGSYALADTQSDFFNQSETTVAEWLADVANQHIIEDLVRVAFPEYEGPCPRISFDAIGSRKEMTTQDLATAVRDGLLIPDKDLEEHWRRLHSLPPKRPIAEAIEERKERQELEDQAGVALNPEVGVALNPEVKALAETVETNARVRAARAETERLIEDILARKLMEDKE